MSLEPCETELDETSSTVSSRAQSDIPVTLTIVEQDGDIIHCICSNGSAVIEVMTEAILVGQILMLNQLHIDGIGPNTFGVTELRECARELGRHFNASMVEIRGGVRTTGSNPGHTPRRIRIQVR